MINPVFSFTPKSPYLCKKATIWICELDGKYYITLYYDNEYNRPHGEDL